MKQTGLFAFAAVTGFAVSFISLAVYARTPSVVYRVPASILSATSTQEAQGYSATILAFGDMMLDRAVRARIATSGPMYPFAQIPDFLSGHDIVVVNAEGPFTHFPSQSVGTHSLTFTFDPEELPTLKKLGFNILSQANNHALNFGAVGLRESQEAIVREGMNTFGDPLNENPGPLYQTVQGIQVAFVGYHQFSGNDTKVLVAIREARAQGAFVIVYPHWGVEYEPLQSGFQQTEGHAFIDAGADVVLGSHPHVIEPIEIYKGKALFYSMGNFIFDQENTGPTSEGLSVKLTLTQTQVSYSLFPLSIKAAQASLMDEKDRARVLSTLSQSAILPAEHEDMRASIGEGSFLLPR